MSFVVKQRNDAREDGRRARDAIVLAAKVARKVPILGRDVGGIPARPCARRGPTRARREYRKQRDLNKPELAPPISYLETQQIGNLEWPINRRGRRTRRNYSLAGNANSCPDRGDARTSGRRSQNGLLSCGMGPETPPSPRRGWRLPALLRVGVAHVAFSLRQRTPRTFHLMIGTTPGGPHLLNR